MRNLLSRVWLPMAAATAAVTGVMNLDRKVETYDGLIGIPVELFSEKQDTVIYIDKGYKKGWDEDMMEEVEMDSIPSIPDSLFDILDEPDSIPAIDSLALKDSLDIADSLNVTDTLSYEDSLAKAKAEFELWYASLSKQERKAYDLEQKTIRKKAQLDSIGERKDSIKAYKDSVLQNTPRILETFFLPDSLYYKRLVSWTHDRSFHKITAKDHDTTFNYHFNDYPFMKEDVNASWLGVAGSPIQYYDFFKRKSSEGVSFYEALESWSYSAETLPFYNTKTPYTELAYWGTLLTSTNKESDNIRIFTTQNITPSWNYSLEYNRYGGAGILDKETTANKTLVASTNYLGKKYLMHAGYIYNMTSRTENGGITDNSMIRDTLVDAREISVALSDANSTLKKHIVFLDQQYRIPFSFLKKNRLGEEDGMDDNITTAFLGHSSEFATYRRKYYDNLKSEAEREFYNDVFNYNPSYSNDSTRVMRFENKIFLRLQPWSAEGVVSKLDVGVGEKLMNYYLFDPTFLHPAQNVGWNATYLYAGAEGQFRGYAFWNAQGKYNFLGDETNDFNINGNVGANIYPFRKARKSPITIKAHFETSLLEPEFYLQHYYSNHYAWKNNFGKTSTTKIQGEIDVPRYRFKLLAGYSLLSGNTYYDTLSIVRQNTQAMSVLSLRIDKDFVLGPVHLDHKLLFQTSSNEEVLPLPRFSANLRYYIQFPVQQVMQMQLGINALYNTLWYAPSYNPAIGVFHNQKEEKYGNCPYFDLFANIQWKRACIFIKWENGGQGWPMEKADYFSANHYIRTQRIFKFGLYWPFYTQPDRKTSSSASGQGNSGLSKGGMRSNSR